MSSVQLFTIGFTKTAARDFFTRMKTAGVKRVVDVRLNNTSQLAGFSKKDDLAYFLKELCGIDYIHLPELAPTEEMLAAYKKHKGSWDVYEQEFLNLMAKRRIESEVARDVVAGGCLLCSELKPHRCHRRLVAEYFKKHWDGVEITHLG